MIRIFVPGDSGARSMGADDVAQAIAVEAGIRGEVIQILRNGSRGMYWLEPLVEVDTPDGRMAYGPVVANDVAELTRVILAPSPTT